MLIDLTGQRFGKLVVERRSIRREHMVYWVCACDCGEKKEVAGAYLKNGKIKSCGCWHREESASRAKRQFERHGLRNTRLYSIWKSMKTRCSNPNFTHYKDYGGRGISVCCEWKPDFLGFYNWAMSSGYDDTLTIDRIDVNGNYCPENCRWAETVEQLYNRRNTVLYDYGGQSLTIRQLSEVSGIAEKTMRDRLKSGWSVERAVSQPVRALA